MCMWHKVTWTSINIPTPPQPSDVASDVHLTHKKGVFSKTVKTLARFSPRWLEQGFREHRPPSGSPRSLTPPMGCWCSITFFGGLLSWAPSPWFQPDWRWLKSWMTLLLIPMIRDALLPICVRSRRVPDSESETCPNYRQHMAWNMVLYLQCRSCGKTNDKFQWLEKLLISYS